jgi:hypothetical protein
LIFYPGFQETENTPDGKTGRKKKEKYIRGRSHIFKIYVKTQHYHEGRYQ